MIQCWKKRLWLEEEGQDLTEYALLLFLLCLISVMAMRGFASSVTNMYSQASGRVIAATTDRSSSASSFVSTGPTLIHADSPHQQASDSILNGTVPLTSQKP